MKSNRLIYRFLSINPAGRWSFRRQERSTRAMRDAVQHQNAELVVGGVAMLGALRGSALPGDGNLTEVAGRLSGRKRKDIGGIVLAAEPGVQLLEFLIARNQALEGRSASDFVLQSSGEVPERLAAQAGGNATEQQRTTVRWIGHTSGNQAFAMVGALSSGASLSFNVN
jgi:hypothetical protein